MASKEVKTFYSAEKLSQMHQDRGADFKSKDPAFVDSIYEQQFNEWLERIYGKPKVKIKLKRRQI